MNLNAQQTRIAGFALIAFAVVMILDLWWLLPVAMLGGAGVAIYRRERSIGQINSAVQGGLWGLGLAVLYVLGAIFPGVLLLGGASLLLRGNEATLRANRAAYERLTLAYRVLVDVSHRDPATTVLGTPVAFPVLVAPTAFQRLAHPEGELATARAAGAAGTVMVLSTLSTTSMEEVVAVATGPVWFQLYVYKDRKVTEGLVRRAEEAGCRALVLTVDAPVIGRRERDIRNRFHLPPGLSVANLLPDGYGELAQAAGDSGLAAYVSALIDPALSWRDLDWLRSITRLPLVIKGIVRPDDAVRAAEAGAAAVVVSNHGGRQLDGAPSTISALPRIADAVGNATEIILDSGVRRGADILKALALGARACMIGKAALYGLGADGEAGVARVLTILRQEFDVAMALSGNQRAAAVRPDTLLP